MLDVVRGIFVLTYLLTNFPAKVNLHVALFQKDMRNLAISRELKTRAFAATAAAAAAADATAAAAVEDAGRPKSSAKFGKSGKGSEGALKLRSPWSSSELSRENTLGGQPRNSTPPVFSPRQLERTRKATVARTARAANAGALMRSVWTASAAYTKVSSK